MSPFHPKLREALLRDPVHRGKGLTASGLLEYEKLVTQLYYLVHYPPAQPPAQPKPITPEDLIEQIKAFRGKYMPNFAAHYRQWIDGQKRATKGHYLKAGFSWRIIKEAVQIFASWLVIIGRGQKKRYEKAG